MMLNRISYYVKPALLPFLLSIFPPIFHYGNNANILLLSSLLRMLAFYGTLGLGLYLVFVMINRRPMQAANAAFVFLIFFNIYVPASDFLLKLDIFQVEHYTALPFLLLCALYASGFMTGIQDGHSIRFWNNMLLILGALITFNIIKIIPAEMEKGWSPVVHQVVLDDEKLSAAHGYPDIYYIVLDEFSGFEPMRQYWGYQEVDEFVNFLTEKGFFVAEESHSASEVTLYELATRLNYQYYPCCKDLRKYFEAIADSRAAQYLRAKGYQIVAFEESRSVFPSDVIFLADYLYENDPNSPPVDDSFLDEFGMLVTDNTMLKPFAGLYKPIVLDPWVNNHKNMIDYTVEKMADLDEVQSPKFVYVHLLLPHTPFMFDAKGNVIDQQHIYDWNYYLGTYIYSIQVAEEMMNKLLSQADPNRPPVIILQSDHGARNQIFHGNEDTLLKDFPEEYKTNILFTLYMPGFDTSAIPQDVNPINTFPIVFNHLFNDNIPLE